LDEELAFLSQRTLQVIVRAECRDQLWDQDCRTKIGNGDAIASSTGWDAHGTIDMEGEVLSEMARNAAVRTLCAPELF